MFRKTFLIILTVSLFLFVTEKHKIVTAKTPEASFAASSQIMQCVANCLKFEGKNATNKNNCKLRCSNTPLPALNDNQKKDCMGLFKKCRDDCKKSDKSCNNSCKKMLMSCS